MDRSLDALWEIVSSNESPYEGSQALERRFPELVERGTILWEALRRGFFETIFCEGVRPALYAEGVAFTPNDVVLVCKALEKTYPDGTRRTKNGNYSLYGAAEVPGLPAFFLPLVQRLETFDPGYRGLLEELSRAPEPFLHGLRMLLAWKGVLPVSELPSEFLSLYANKLTSKALGFERPWWLDVLPWERSVWQDALLQSARKATELHSAWLFYELRTQPVSTVLPLLERLVFSGNSFLYEWTLPRLDEWAKEHRNELEAVLLRMDRSFEGSTNGEAPWAPFYPIAAYLRACAATEHTPPATLDSLLLRMATKYQCVSGFGPDRAWLDPLRALFSVLPRERLCAQLLLSKPPPWWLLSLCKTPEVLLHTARSVLALPRVLSVDWDRRLPKILEELSPEFGVVAAEALLEENEPRPHEALLYPSILQTRNSESALRAQVTLLSSQDESVRTAARKALLQQPEQAPLLLLLLSMTLGSQEEAVRTEAARVLASLPASAERIALAQQALAEEKRPVVRSLLEEATRETQGAIASAASNDATEVLAFFRFGFEEEFETHPEEFAKRFQQLRACLRIATEQQSPQLDDLVRVGVEGFVVCHARLSIEEQKRCLEELLRAMPYLALAGGIREALESLSVNAQLPEVLAEFVNNDPFSVAERKGSAEAKSADVSFMEYCGAHPDLRVLPYLLRGLQSKRLYLEWSKGALQALGTAVLEPLLKMYDLASPRGSFFDPALDVLMHCSKGEEQTLHALSRAERAQHGERKESASRALVWVGFRVLEQRGFSVNSVETESTLEKAIEALPCPALPAWLSAQTKLPVLRWAASQKAVSTGATLWLFALLSRLSTTLPLADVRRLLQLIDAQDRANAWKALDALLQAPLVEPGVLLVAPLGDDAAVSVLTDRIQQAAHSAKTHWGADAIFALQAHGSVAALRSLDLLSRTSKVKALKNAALAAIDALAKERNTTASALLDVVLPDYGFRSDGSQTWTSEKGAFVLSLDDSFAVQLQNESGKALKAASAFKGCAEEATFKSNFKTIEKELLPALRAAVQRLEIAMCTARSWTQEGWEALFRKHPLFLRVAQSLVFSADRKQYFTLRSDGTCVDAQERSVVLVSGAELRIAHPVVWSAAQRQEWGQCFERRKRAQPFEQCARETFVRAAGEALTTGLRLPGEAEFKRRLPKFGFEAGPRGEAGLVYVSSKHYGAWELRLHHPGYHPSLDYGFELVVERVECLLSGVRVAEEQLPQEFWSEVRRELLLLHRV